MHNQLNLYIGDKNQPNFTKINSYSKLKDKISNYLQERTNHRKEIYFIDNNNAHSDMIEIRHL